VLIIGAEIFGVVFWGCLVGTPVVACVHSILKRAKVRKSLSGGRCDSHKEPWVISKMSSKLNSNYEVICNKGCYMDVPESVFYRCVDEFILTCELREPLRTRSDREILSVRRHNSIYNHKVA